MHWIGSVSQLGLEARQMAHFGMHHDSGCFAVGIIEKFFGIRSPVTIPAKHGAGALCGK